MQLRHPITRSPIGAAALAFIFCTAASAITWSFDTDGDAQGWTAVQGINSGQRVDLLAPLRTEAHDGILQITIPWQGEHIRPSVELVSPRIGRASELFDRVTIRLRLVQPTPSIGSFLLCWTNPLNEHSPGLAAGFSPIEEERRLAAGLLVWQKDIAYSSGWREYTVSGLSPGAPVPGHPADTLAWQGTLFDIRAELMLSATPVSLTQWPQVLEVDWIRLTGPEEQLQGELPPPTVTGVAYGALFAPSVVSPVSQQGLVETQFGSFWLTNRGGLGDLDGDGELELVLQYREGGNPFTRGWVELDCNGGDRYSLCARHTVEMDDVPLLVVVAAANKDGRSDLLVSRWGAKGGSQVLLNDPERGWVTGQEWPAEVKMMGWADGDGDGWVDAWSRTLGEGCYQLLFHRGLGDGSFAPAQRILDSPIRFRPLLFARNAGSGRVTGVLQAPLDDQNRYTGHGYEVTYLDADGNAFEKHLAVDLQPALIRYAGDVDDDGDIDLLAATEECYLLRQGDCTRGVSLWVNQGDGSFNRVDWLPEAVLPVGIPEPVLVTDLNGDGRKDYALVDVSERQPSLWVGLGQSGGGIQTEGRYLLAGGTYGPLYAGDLDSDGYLDLITVRGDIGSEGVCVWRNEGYRRSTAVRETSAAIPGGFRLESNYPNPFNPRTWIPLDLPATDQPVSLRVYNLLGQPVRTLVNGRLEPGSHTIPWDGTDDRGRPLPSGVYLCRFQSAGYQETIRMAKVD